MQKPEFKQFGITEEEFDSMYAKKEKLRNYTFGTASAVGIITGCMVGLYLSKGAYETILFILFFGCFLGSLFGAVFTIITVKLNALYLYTTSSTYRNCRQYLAARAKAQFVDYREYP